MSDPYIEELEKCAMELCEAGVSVSITDEGAGSFLLAERGPRGIELYRGENGSVVIDPAEDKILKGEIVLGSYKDAISTALRWLNEGDA